MSIESNVYLSPNTRFADVQKVLARLYGGTEDTVIILYEPNGPEMGTVFVQTKKAFEGEQSYVIDLEKLEAVSDSRPRPEKCVPCDRFVWSFEGRSGTRNMWRVTSPWTTAVFKALVDFFGGCLEHDEEQRPGYATPHKSDDENHPTEEPEWEALQERIAAVRPLDTELLRG